MTFIHKILMIVAFALLTSCYEFNANLSGNLVVHEGKTIQLNLSNSVVTLASTPLFIKISQGTFAVKKPSISFYQNNHFYLGEIELSEVNFETNYAFSINGEKLGQKYNIKGTYQLITLQSYESDREVDCHYPCLKNQFGLNPSNGKTESFQGWGQCSGTQRERREYTSYRGQYQIDFFDLSEQNIVATFNTSPSPIKTNYKVISSDRCQK